MSGEWEYKLVKDGLLAHGSGANLTALDAALDALGTDDWELVGNIAPGSASVATLAFKRATRTMRVITLKVANIAGVLSSEILTSADDAASEVNVYTGMDSEPTPLLWTITTGAQTDGPYVLGEVVTGGTSGRTGVVVSTTATTIVIKGWSGLAWTAAETLTGAGGTTSAFSAIAPLANAHGLSIEVASRATTNRMLFDGENANNAAGFGGVANVIDDTTTGQDFLLTSAVAIKNRGVTAGWLVSHDALALNTTNVDAGTHVTSVLMFYAKS